MKPFFILIILGLTACGGSVECLDNSDCVPTTIAGPVGTARTGARSGPHKQIIPDSNEAGAAGASN